MNSAKVEPPVSHSEFRTEIETVEGTTMRPGVNLTYLEGEVKGGRLTGRTILVIETDRKLDSDGSAPSDLKQLVRAACVEWEKICCPADLVRVEYHASGENEASNGSTTSYRSIGFLAGR